MDVFDFPASLAERQSSPAASASPAASSSSAESASFGYGGAGAATTGSVFPRTFSNQRKQRRASSHRAPELTKGGPRQARSSRPVSPVAGPSSSAQKLTRPPLAVHTVGHGTARPRSQSSPPAPSVPLRRTSPSQHGAGSAARRKRPAAEAPPAAGEASPKRAKSGPDGNFSLSLSQVLSPVADAGSNVLKKVNDIADSVGLHFRKWSWSSSQPEPQLSQEEEQSEAESESEAEAVMAEAEEAEEAGEEEGVSKEGGEGARNKKQNLHQG